MLKKTYQPTDIEQHWANYWEKQGFSQPMGSGKPYCIMLPPPNVTGTLHMGHGFQYSLMDTLIRYHRMQGDNTLWQGGTDHAGIATQMVVERQLAQQDISRHDLGRDAFLKTVWEWKHQSGQTITQQIRRMGASIDWSRERFTMDDAVSRATLEAFVRLYEEGLIYRGKKLVNWDPKLKTAISDLEVSTDAEKGYLWHIRYPIENSPDYIIVATTRPETMLGDTAVAVHPNDERYKKYVGSHIQLPLTDRFIPIIADDAVDPAFGTGCVKITPAHDFNDYAMGQRHQLPMINMLTLDAHLNDTVPEKYRGLERFAARKQIITDLRACGLLEKIEPHEHNIPRGDRSGVVVEPMLTDQWFVKMNDMAKAALRAFENRAVEFIPDHWGKTYVQWLENIQDWCISRQLWWGHRIPVWYDLDGKQYVGLHEADVRKRHNLSDKITLKQDDDVLDTWFSASLWPFATLGWPQHTADFQTFYPTSVLVTGFDIIFFWVARMVMMGLKLAGKVPFKQVYITGLIRDSQGQKMSKSKGNILDPIDLVDGISLEALLEKRTTGLMQPHMEKAIRKQTEKEFPEGIPASGTDAVRFTFCALATTGRNINFDLARLIGYRNFCNKIWNAARYVLMNVDGTIHASVHVSVADQWILFELHKTIDLCRRNFSEFRFDQLANHLFEFVWNQYCDWYLEFSKCDLSNDTVFEEQKQGTRHTLLSVLENMMRLIHPVMPFISEEIWQQVTPQLNISGDSIMLASYPTANSTIMDDCKMAHAEIECIKILISEIRNLRGQNNISPAKKIDMFLKKNSNGVKNDWLEKYFYYIKTLAKCDNIRWLAEHEKISESISGIAQWATTQLEIYIPLSGLIDKSAELLRLKQELEKLERTKQQTQARLSNATFVEKAPAEVVAQARAQLLQCEETIEKLRAHHACVKGM